MADDVAATKHNFHATPIVTEDAYNYPALGSQGEELAPHA